MNRMGSSILILVMLLCGVVTAGDVQHVIWQTGTAPENLEVLCAMETDDHTVVVPCEYGTGWWYIAGRLKTSKDRVTHWMEYPVAPDDVIETASDVMSIGVADSINSIAWEEWSNEVHDIKDAANIQTLEILPMKEPAETEEKSSVWIFIGVIVVAVIFLWYFGRVRRIRNN